jgi:flagellar FliL protein
MSAAAAAADATPAKKPGRMKKIILMAAIAALVLGGGGVGLMVYLGKQRAAAEAAADEEDGGHASSTEKKKGHRSPPVFVPMDNFVVNLADHDADRYAQIGVTLEVTDDKQAEEIKTYMPAIRNNVLLLLAHKASADLAGGEGKRLLAREIRREALRAMGEDLPDDDEEGAASAPKSKKKKKKAEDAPEPSIRSVQFSSFIIQ